MVLIAPLLTFLCVSLALFGHTHSQSLYITFHGGSGGYSNIAVYSLTGTYLGNLLASEQSHDSLRGMASTNASLFICSAKDNTIIATSGCGASPTVVASTALSHPYGIALDEKLNRIYVSNQDGDNVVYFDNGASLGNGIVFASGVISPRGIAVDPVTSNVYVASETLQAVLGFDTSGSIVIKIPVQIPIGVYVEDSVLYYSDRGSTPASYGYNLSTGKVTTYPSEDGHPTGVIKNGNVLYVLGQDNQKLYSFDVATGASLGTVITFTQDVPEQILLGPCTTFSSD